LTDTEKKRASSKETLIRLLGYLWRHKGRMILAVIFTLAGNILALFIPKFAGQAIDAIGTAGSVNFTAVFTLCGYMLACVLMNSLFMYLTQAVLVKVSSLITAEMRKELFDHLTTLPVAFFDHHASGDIISRISYDIDTINTSLSSDLVDVLTSAITVIGSFVMMCQISWKLCVVFFFTTPIMIYITKHRATVVRPLFHKRSVKLGELNGFAEEMLSGHKTIKAYGQEETIISRFDEKNDDAVDAYYEADYQGSIVGPTVTFVNNLSLAIISGLGGLLYLGHEISIGNISAFILYSKRFSGPISEMADIMAELQSAISAARRVFAMIDEPSELADDRDAVVLDHCQGDVAFENVHFSYVPGKEIIHGLDLNAEAGRMIAIVGPTGAGKTTIINMLMRFYDPDSGTIKVDGVDICHCTRDSLRKQFSMVLQDTWLFEGTIYENVAYGRDNVTKEEVEQVCRAVDIHDFVMSLKDGYDTVLTDSGVNISKGQKQLLTIARAMLSEAKMLILDEATSNVDSNTEQKIQKAMLELCKGKTTFIIAHRLSTIQSADEILVLSHGTVMERGTHEQLLKKKGFYASLFNAQWDE
jgi:ATP-binding cassette subfamily B protein